MGGAGVLVTLLLCYSGGIEKRTTAQDVLRRRLAPPPKDALLFLASVSPFVCSFESGSQATKEVLSSPDFLEWKNMTPNAGEKSGHFKKRRNKKRKKIKNHYSLTPANWLSLV